MAVAITIAAAIITIAVATATIVAVVTTIAATAAITIVAVVTIIAATAVITIAVAAAPTGPNAPIVGTSAVAAEMCHVVPGMLHVAPVLLEATRAPVVVAAISTEATVKVPGCVSRSCSYAPPLASACRNGQPVSPY